MTNSVLFFYNFQSQSNFCELWFPRYRSCGLRKTVLAIQLGTQDTSPSGAFSSNEFQAVLVCPRDDIFHFQIFVIGMADISFRKNSNVFENIMRNEMKNELSGKYTKNVSFDTF